MFYLAVAVLKGDSAKAAKTIRAADGFMAALAATSLNPFDKKSTVEELSSSELEFASNRAEAALEGLLALSRISQFVALAACFIIRKEGLKPHQINGPSASLLEVYDPNLL